MDSERLQACEKLLSQAYLSYVRHEEGRREPFNVFTVLRSESDEVRLHSRFLAALLDHRKAPGEPRENLKHFLKVKDIVGCSDFDLNGVMVERERDNIDILVSNTARQAVVIENKIWAGDQPEQLKRYHESLRERGFEDKNIHLLYLTPHGHDPSEDSQGGLDVACISYVDTLPPWLEGCRQRACDEPELRESIAQYLHLARKLTGTNLGRKYMNELRDLLEKENNLVLTYDLSVAMIETKALLLKKLFEEIEETLESKLGQDGDSKKLKRSDEYSDIRSEYIAKQLTKSRYTGFQLSWQLSGKYKKAALAVGGDITGKTERIHIGIICPAWKEECKAEHNDLKNNLKLDGIFASEGWQSMSTWVWNRQTSHGFRTREQLERLSQDKERRELAESIAQELWKVWEKAHE